MCWPWRSQLSMPATRSLCKTASVRELYKYINDLTSLSRLLQLLSQAADLSLLLQSSKQARLRRFCVVRFVCGPWPWARDDKLGRRFRAVYTVYTIQYEYRGTVLKQTKGALNIPSGSRPGNCFISRIFSPRQRANGPRRQIEQDSDH